MTRSARGLSATAELLVTCHYMPIFYLFREGLVVENLHFLPFSLPNSLLKPSQGVLLKIMVGFLSRVSILTPDIDIAILSVRSFVRLSVCLFVTLRYSVKTD